MTEIRFESEKELIEGIKPSQVYKEFSSKYLGLKIDREKRAFQLLAEHRGQYTREILIEGRLISPHTCFFFRSTG